MNGKRLLVLEHANVLIKRREQLTEVNLEICKDDFIGIYGANGSGKSLLAELICGNIKSAAGSYLAADPLKTAVVSTEEQKIMLEQERHDDDSEFMEGRVDPGRSVLKILKTTAATDLEISEVRYWIELFGMEELVERGIRFLSTGEFRKMLIIKALLSKPDILVLDDPYTGLDIETRRRLQALLGEIRQKVGALVIISGRLNDLTSCSRFFLLRQKTVKETASADELQALLQQAPAHVRQITKPIRQLDSGSEGEELISMQSVNLSYYEERILTDINWKVLSGGHWQIAGPNGSGKSTLLSLVTGDNPKAYGQNIRLFGVKRGSGETIWDIKQKIGYVSGSLQQQHRISQNVLSVVVSGFFDTIGLYQRPDPVQLGAAKDLCREFGIDNITGTPFSSLSEGMKRTVLILRAIIKKPQLIILDEPCQGLDDLSSETVLAAAEGIMLRNHSTLLYVSHDPDYRMKHIDRIMKLVRHEKGGYTAQIS